MYRTAKEDKERLDALQDLTNQSGHLVICRFSNFGRGWRLHEVPHEEYRSGDGYTKNIRDAIDRFLLRLNRQ